MRVPASSNAMFRARQLTVSASAPRSIRGFAREKAALEERVEKLEAELADYARDEQASRAAEFQLFALAGEIGERVRWPQN